MSAEDSDNFDEDMDLEDYDEAMGDEPFFWSMSIEPNKTIDISEPAIPGYIVHITNACFGLNVNKNSRTVVMINDTTPICTLIEGKHENQQLDLLFNEAATIAVKGNKPSTVSLIGYIQPSIDQDAMDPMAEDMTEAEITEVLKRQKEQQQILDDEENDDKQKEEEEEDEEEEPQLIDEDDIEEPPTKKQKTAKGSKSTKNGNTSSSEEKKRKSPQQKAKTVEKEKEKEKEDESADDSSKKKKKNKKMQNMKGGIKYRDMRVGPGDVLQNGNKVSVFYVGQLDDKKVFDKTISGNGFEFNFGQGDVIKGWDIGLKGMRVGGKRKLVIPPKLAYGKNGSPPNVPPNATLTFTIEVKSVN